MSPIIFAEKYVVQEEIAKGGMGVVFKALDRTLNRVVAIKQVHAHLSSDPSFSERFLREARAMARLHHENIVTIFSVEQDRGTQFLVMEYFPGTNLRSLIHKHTRLPLRESVTIAQQMAKALAYAHTHGIVHRDIKPANILVDPNNKTKLTDFGIAAALDDSSITSTGQVIGTPEYMSPEQARGIKLDGRSDLYSLGIVLYELLTGSTPYRDIPKTSILGRLITDQQDLRLDFPSGIPSYLQSLVRELTRVDPADRIESADTLATQLTELLYSLPSTKAGLLHAPEPAPTVIVSSTTMQSSQDPPAESDRTLAQPRTRSAPTRPSTSQDPTILSPSTLSPSTTGEDDSSTATRPTRHIERSREQAPSQPSKPHPEAPSRPTDRRLVPHRLVLAASILVLAVGVVGYYLFPPLDTSPSPGIPRAPISNQTHPDRGQTGTSVSALPMAASRPDGAIPAASTATTSVHDIGPTRSSSQEKETTLEDERRKLQEDQARFEEKQRLAMIQKEKEQAESAQLSKQRIKQSKERELAAQRAKQAERQRQADEAAQLEQERQKLEAQRAGMEEERKRIAEEQERLAKNKERADQQANIEEQQRKAQEAARLEKERREMEARQAELDATRKQLEQNEARLAKEKELSLQRERDAEQRRLADERAAQERAEQEKALQRAKEEADRKRLAEERQTLERERKRIEDEQMRLAKEKEADLQRAREAEQRRLADERAAHERAEKEKAHQRVKEEAERKRLEEERIRAAQEVDRQKNIQIAKASPKEQLRILLDRFRSAYEQRDLADLQNMSRMSEDRLRNIQLMFGNYATLKVSLKTLSETEEGATAVLTLDSAVKPDGETVDLSPLAKNIRVTIPREGSGWGKIIW